jgi:hypothetical protein
VPVFVLTTRKLGFLAGALAGWVVFRVTALPQSREALACVLVFLAVSQLYTRRWDKWIEQGLALSTLLACVQVPFFYVIAQFGVRWGRLGGFLDQPSMVGCLLVVGIPFLHRVSLGKTWLLVTYFVMAAATILLLLITNGASSPVGAAAVLVAIWYAISQEESPERVCLAAFQIAVFLMASGYMISAVAEGEGISFLNSSDRLRFWKFFLTKWWEGGDVWFGNGLGTFVEWGHKLQIANNFGVKYVQVSTTAYRIDNLWAWAHSDWIQTLIEFGVIGLCLAGLTFLRATYCAYEQKRFGLVASICAFGAVMGPQYPWRLAPFAAAGVGLLCMALNKEERCIPKLTELDKSTVD